MSGRDPHSPIGLAELLPQREALLTYPANARGHPPGIQPHRRPGK
jgi:hypothetical protein